ncbi:MAG: SO2930 family diheme c-type cytochrome [Erythrobacter sp.]
MIRSAAILGAAALALAGTLAARATVLNLPAVHDEAVMEGMPRSLSDFRFFDDLSRQLPNDNVIGYRLNTALYSDGADKLRFIYLPEGTKLEAQGQGLLKFPVGAAIIKTFAFGEGEDRRLIETRVLLHREGGWTALPYKWNEEQTEATLALAGARLALTRPDGKAISYRVPNMNQCATCHSIDGEIIPIGPKSRNLPFTWQANLHRVGDLRGSSPELSKDGQSVGWPLLPHWEHRDQVNIDAIARAYLDVNCAHCHQPGGSASNSGLDLRWEQDDPHAIGIRKPPVAAGRGAGGHKVSIAPGDPDASILLYRMQSTEPGVAMPELSRSTVDDEGVAVIRQWIAGMGQ